VSEPDEGIVLSRHALELRHMSESARDTAVREAFRGTGIYTASERLWLVGPPQVVAAGNEAFHSLRRIRDAYARGGGCRLR
jgi:hypothetical protein